jgi:hypothetical protein
MVRAAGRTWRSSVFAFASYRGLKARSWPARTSSSTLCTITIAHLPSCARENALAAAATPKPWLRTDGLSSASSHHRDSCPGLT